LISKAHIFFIYDVVHIF